MNIIKLKKPSITTRTIYVEGDDEPMHVRTKEYKEYLEFVKAFGNVFINDLKPLNEQTWNVYMPRPTKR